MEREISAICILQLNVKICRTPTIFYEFSKHSLELVLRFPANSSKIVTQVDQNVSKISAK